MSELYLRSVEFSNFRVYGDSYAFELLNGPGVTLITGANGLGKTSFFDGVEWALTDQVSRFQDIAVDGRRRESDPLTRIGAPVNSHRVSLQFSDGMPIDRGAGFPTDETAIARLLKRPEWSEITNLHGYLSITHFLGQSAAQRFSLRKPEKQWEALKGPAGVDRINTLRERMSGQGVRRAFTRAIELRTKKLEDASNAIVAWNNLLSESKRAHQLSSSDEAVQPSALRSTIEGFAGQVVNLFPGVRWPPADPNVLPEALLVDFGALLRTIEQLNIKDIEAAEMLAEIASEFDNAGNETLATRKLANDIEERRVAAAALLIEAEATLLEARAKLASCQKQTAQEQNRMAMFSRVRAAARQLDELLARQMETAAQLQKSVAETARVETRIEALQGELSKSTAQRSERRAMADQVTLARRREQISLTLAATRAEIDRLLPVLAGKLLPDIREQRSRLADEATAAANEVARYSAALQQHDDRVRTIAEAVSAIAHRLVHDDVACPVCKTEFAPGFLAEFVRRQSESDERPASELATSLATARVTGENLRREIGEIDRAIMEIEQLRSTIGNLRAREQEHRQQLVEAGGSADGVYDQSATRLLENQLASMDEHLSKAQTPEQIAVRIGELEALLKAESIKHLTLQRVSDATQEEIDVARITLRQHPELWDEQQGFLVDVNTEQARTEDRLRGLSEQVASASLDVDNAQHAHDSLRETEAREAEARNRSNAQLDALAGVRAVLARRWIEAGQTGEPDGGRVAQQRSRNVERSAQVERVRAVQQRLVIGYRKWLNDEQLRKLEDQIAEMMRQAAASTEFEVGRELERRAKAARYDLELAQSARERVDIVGEQMQQRADLYADEVLVPLNATIQRFARTLMTWSDASIIYRAEHHVTRSELRPGIVRSGIDGSTTQLEMNPNLYFSEGQLSALSVAALMAASTTFGWSRWRALLLDDPLQHNDVIHASAFMDLLRQMVRELGYQVILSTHDSAEAEFLGRKCRSAGIPYHVHELAPHGDNGLISKVA